MSTKAVKSIVVIGMMGSSFMQAMEREQSPEQKSFIKQEVEVADAAAQQNVPVIWGNVKKKLPVTFCQSLEKSHTQEQLDAALELLISRSLISPSLASQDSFTFMRVFLPILMRLDKNRMQYTVRQNKCWDHLACTSLIWTSKWAFRGICGALIMICAAFRIQCTQ